jgi:two-component system chemotaxis response regulator CheY
MRKQGTLVFMEYGQNFNYEPSLEKVTFMTRVLVADDSSTMRKIILRSLQAVGVTDVTEAADGSEALAIFKPGQFDLVLTDWNMPGMTGLEVLQGIRAQDAAIPVIMVTTEAEKTRVLQAIQAGVSDYLVKPFTADTLREKLEKHGC